MHIGLYDKLLVNNDLWMSCLSGIYIVFIVVRIRRVSEGWWGWARGGGGEEGWWGWGGGGVIIMTTPCLRTGFRIYSMRNEIVIITMCWNVMMFTLYKAFQRWVLTPPCLLHNFLFNLVVKCFSVSNVLDYLLLSKHYIFFRWQLCHYLVTVYSWIFFSWSSIPV